MPAEPHMQPGDAIAIVGIGGMFAASESPDRLWANVLAGTDTTREVPPGRWLVEPDDALDPRIAQPDRVYTIRGGFIGPVRFDPTGTALDPALVDRLDPAFHLALSAAGEAWRDAQDRAPGPRRRVRAWCSAISSCRQRPPRRSRSTLLGRMYDERLGIPDGGPGDLLQHLVGPNASSSEPRNAFPADPGGD